MFIHVIFLFYQQNKIASYEIANKFISKCIRGQSTFENYGFIDTVKDFLKRLEHQRCVAEATRQVMEENNVDELWKDTQEELKRKFKDAGACWIHLVPSKVKA